MTQTTLKYPNEDIIKELLTYSPNMKVYKHFGEDGNLLAQYELREDTWYDVTDRELAKIELEKAKMEAEKHSNKVKLDDDVIDMLEYDE